MTIGFQYPAPDTIEATEQHTGTIVMLHGLGDNSQQLLPMGSKLSGLLPHVKWIFPTAPKRTVTMHGGESMPAWCDVPGVEELYTIEDSSGLEESTRYIGSLVQSEIDAGIPASRIVVAGFSQGGAIALMMLRSSFQLAAVVGLSTYLPMRSVPGVVSKESQGTPVFLAHGAQDPVLTLEHANATLKKLKEHGLTVDFRSYPVEHATSDEEVQDLGTFLRDALS